MTLQLRGGKESEVEGANPSVSEREPVLVFDDVSGELISYVVGKVIDGSVGTTQFLSLPRFHPFTADEKTKLSQLEVLTAELINDTFNAGYNVNLAAIAQSGGYTGPQIVSLITATEGNDLWKSAKVKTFNNRSPDIDGNLLPAANDYSLTDISGLSTALDGKSDVGHGHTIAQIADLQTTLNSKVNTSDINSIVNAAVAAAVGDTVVSVHGRTGTVVAASGDYNAGQVTATPGGTLAGNTVAAQLSELDSEKIPLTAINANNGVAGLDGGGKLLSSLLATHDSAVVVHKEVVWKDTTSNETVGAATQEQANQGRRPILDLTNATHIVAHVFVGTEGATNAEWRCEYSLNGGSSWTTTGATVLFGSAGSGLGAMRYGTEVAMPAGAQTSATMLRLVSQNGDGTTQSTTGYLGVRIRYTIPINTGTPTGAQMVSAINATLGSTNWQGSSLVIDDNSVSLAKLVNATAPSLIGRLSGSGTWTQMTPADARTLLGVSTGGVSSVFGRSGAVVAASGDYTTAQLTESTDKKFVTDQQLLKIARAGTVNKFTTSATVGFAEMGAIFASGSTVLTATISNAAVNQSIAIANHGTQNVNIVPQSGVTMQNAQGGSITSYTLQPATGVNAPAAACFFRDGSVFRLS